MADTIAKRFPSYYKTLIYTDDIITKGLKKIYAEKYEHKFNIAKEEDIGLFAGPNAWTEGLQYYDLKNYKHLEILNVSVNDLTDKEKLRVGFMNKISFGVNSKDPMLIVNGNRKVLLEFMKYRAIKEQSDHTLLSDIKFIHRLLKIYTGQDSELSTKYCRLQVDFDYIIVRQSEGNNTLSANEKVNWVKFKMLLSTRDKLEEEWRDLMRRKDEFNNKSGIENALWRKHYAMLLLSCYTLTPPVRRELFTISFVQSEDEDYIEIPEDKHKRVRYVFKKEKKGHNGTEYQVGYDAKSGKKLSELIRESYELYPRRYVFPQITDKNRKAQESTIARYIKTEICKDITLTIDILRSSYITWRNNSKGYTYNMRKKDAEMMRNNIGVQLQYYNKLVSSSDSEDDRAGLWDESEEPPSSNTCVTVPVNEERYIKSENEKNIENRKKYYAEHKAKENEVSREYYKNNQERISARKAVKRINENKTEPSEKVIERYELYKLNGLWRSGLLDD
eukprot:766374-Hanusia_phi.AAC.2